MRILIIDDHREHGESLAELLNSRGHEAYFAPNFLEAEWLYGLFRFELSLIDFDMPDHNGAEVAFRLRQHSPDSEMVIMSAHHPGEIPPEVLGGLPFFPKPIEVASLIGFIEGLLLRKNGAPLAVRANYPLLRVHGDREAE